MLDNLNQPVQPHPDFFVPLELKLPQADKDALQNGIIARLQEQHKNSDRLWFNGANEVGYNFKATQELADSFLRPMGLKADIMGVFIVKDNLYDRNIHVDTARMETRLNFYEMAEAPGVVRWFPDTGDGYDSYDINLGGAKFLDYTYPWLTEFKKGKLDWKDIPKPIWSTSTNCSSALVRTNFPHHVIQGNGLRVTITCRVVDLITGSVTNTWAKIKS